MLGSFYESSFFKKDIMTSGAFDEAHLLDYYFSSVSPMITSMKSRHERVPFKHSVVRLYSSRFMLNIV